MPEHSRTADIACSLTDEELRVVRTGKIEAGLELTFPNTDTLRSDVETFVSLERQCCGFLTFTVTPPDQGLTVIIEGPPEAQATLEMFAAALASDPCARGR